MAHRILVFEADTQFASELRNGFAGRDVELEIVSEGKKGLEQAAATPPDLILLSIELPSMNGFLVCKKIKKKILEQEGGIFWSTSGEMMKSAK